MSERLKEIMNSDSLRIGVWVEDDKVLRRDSHKAPYATVYEPASQEDLEKVRGLARQLHNGATMPHWTAQVEAQQKETVDELQSLLKKTQT